VYIRPELISGGSASNPNIYEPPLVVTTTVPVPIEALEPAVSERSLASHPSNCLRPPTRMHDSLHTF
jgi:hypothetical protein